MPTLKTHPTNGAAVPLDVDKLADAAHKPVKAIAAAVHAAIDHAAEIAPSLKARQQQLYSETCKYVSAHPMKSLGIALAAGLLISRILR